MSFSNYVCVKYSILLLNIFLLVSGIIIASLGVYVKKFYYSYESFVTDQYLYAPNFLVVLGAIIFVIAFIGCCGILTENSCLNLTFTTFLVLIFFFEMGVGIAGYIMKEEAQEYLQETLPITMTKYNTDADTRLAWTTIQSTFNCCGTRSAKDWKNIKIKIPLSCYSNPADGSAPVLHHVGCLEAFGSFVKKHSSYIEIVGLSLALLQLLGIICSCLLTNYYRKGYETV